MRFGNARIGEQERGCLGFHRGAAIGMQGELTRYHRMLGDDVVEQSLEQSSTFGMDHPPTDHAPAEDVEDDV
jgi:hypothetical protein